MDHVEQEEQEQIRQDPHAVVDPEHPFGREPAKRVYNSHTQKMMRILNNPARIDPATDKDAFDKLCSVQAGTAVGARMEQAVKLLLKYNIPDWDFEYRVIHDLFTTAILRGSQTIPIGVSPRIVFTLEDAVLLCSSRSPVPQSGNLLFILLQQGYTHVELLKTGSRDVGEVSIPALARHLMRSLREPTPFGLYGLPQMLTESRADVYPHLVEILGHFPVPVAEANKSIESILEDLREHAQHPEYAYIHDKDGERNLPLHPMQYWRLQRGMRSIMWSTISNLMANPPNEQDAPRTGAELDRLDIIQDPESGYWVNKADAFLKSVELGQREDEVNNSRAANGIHPKEFSALGFPQRFVPTLASLSPAATVIACAGIVGGIIGLRIWTNRLVSVVGNSKN